MGRLESIHNAAWMRRIARLRRRDRLKRAPIAVPLRHAKGVLNAAVNRGLVKLDAPDGARINVREHKDLHSWDACDNFAPVTFIHKKFLFKDAKGRARRGPPGITARRRLLCTSI